jgi:hypothetical protein
MGARVTVGKYLYKAVQDVPPNTPITDQAYWITQGDGGDGGDGTPLDVVEMTTEEVDSMVNSIIGT